jgi:threonine/homoserine/homoserine lactone efflux protein
MIPFILQGVGFGFAAGTSPGPLQSFIISTTLRTGWQRALLVIVSPLITDAPIILVMTFLLQQLPPGVIQLIQIAGGTFALWLAWDAWKAVQQGERIGPEDSPEIAVSRRQLLSRAAVINFLGPGPYIFWGAVTGPILIDALSQSALHAVLFLVSFYGTFLMLLAALVIVFDRVRRLDPRIARGAQMIAAVVLALLGAGLILQGLLG